MKKTFLLPSLFSLLLVACNGLSPYAVDFPRDNSPEFRTITIEEAYNKVIVDSQYIIVTFGVLTCETCINFRNEASQYVIDKGVSIYYVDISQYSDAERTLLNDISTFNDLSKAYLFSSITAFPVTYVFSDEMILFAFSGNPIMMLNKYVNVVD